MSDQTDKSDALYDTLSATIEQHEKGMTTYQIIGTLMSLIVRLWERNAKVKEDKK